MSDNVRWFLLGTIFFVVFFLGLNKISGPDPYWHIKSGEYIFNNGFPSYDPFTFTSSDQKWFGSEWLSEIIFYIIYREVGFVGLTIFKSLILALTFVSLFHILCLWKCPVFLNYIVVIVVAFVTRESFSIRPQIFSYLFLIIYLWIIMDFIKGKRMSIFPLFPIMIIWTNLHAAYITGIYLFGLILFGEAFTYVLSRLLHMKRGYVLPRKMILKLFMSFLVVYGLSYISPSQKSILGFLYHNTQLIKEYGITEYQPLITSFQQMSSRAALMIIYVFVVILSPSQFNSTTVSVFLGFLVPTLFVRRTSVEFFLVTSPIVLDHLTALGNCYGIKNILKAFTSPFWIKLSAAAIFPASLITHLFLNPFDRSVIGFGPHLNLFPSGTIKFIQSNLDDERGFNSLAFGGPLIFELFPPGKVFWYTKFHGYEKIFREVNDIKLSVSRFNEMLQKYGIHYAAIDRDSLYKNLFPKEQWALVYWDDISLIFLRRENVHQNTINKYEFHLIDPESIYSHEFLNVLETPGKREAAKTELLRALSMNNLSSLAHYALGNVYLSSGNIGEAIQEFHTSLQITPWNPNIYNDLGVAYAYSGRIDLAEKEFMKALSLDDNLAEAHKNLGFLYIKTMRYKEGLKYLKTSLKLAPQQKRAREIEYAITILTSRPGN